MTKTCPLCDQKIMERWPDGSFRLDHGDLDKFSLNGFTYKQIKSAIEFALNYGWKP